MTESSKSTPWPTIVAVALTAASLALAASWLFVLRPAANDADSATVTVEDFVNTETKRGDATQSAEIGEPAPDLDLVRFTGGILRVSDLAGKPTIINFWASTCAP